MKEEALWNIPENWVWTRMKAVGEIVGGGTPSTKEASFWGDEVAWISPADLTGFTRKTMARGAKSLTQAGLENSSARLMPAGSVHFSTRAPIGYVVISSAPLATNQGFKSVVPAEGIYNEYVYYYLKSAKQLAQRRASGTTFLELSGTAFGLLPLPLAPLNEQRRIVAKLEKLFSELDKGVDSLKTAREQLKVYRQAVLKSAFEGRLTAQWRQENAGKLQSTEELLARIKQERETRYQQNLQRWKAAVNAWKAKGKVGKKPGKPAEPDFKRLPSEGDLPELPLGWAWARVENLCEVVRGGSPRPAGDKRYYDGTIPFLKVADVTRKRGVYLHTFTYTIKEAGLQKTRRVEPNTLLISNSGATLGVPAICLIDATFNDGIAAFLGLAKEELLYHYYFWSSKTAELRGINQGAAQPNLNTDLLKETFIPVCSAEEMQVVASSIESALSICERVSEEIEENLKRCNALRQAILTKAFCGRLADQDPGDEPASVLLGRIKAARKGSEKGGSDSDEKDAA